VLEADGSFKVIAVFGEAGGGAGTWTALVGVVVHSPHWGGRPGWYWCARNPWRGEELDRVHVHGDCWHGVNGCWVVAEVVVCT